MYVLLVTFVVLFIWQAVYGLRFLPGALLLIVHPACILFRHGVIYVSIPGADSSGVVREFFDVHVPVFMRTAAVLKKNDNRVQRLCHC